jgi:uncharacterized protein YkwD
MKKVLLALIVISFCSMDHAPVIDRGEAKQAFIYLNKIRMSPQTYEKIFHSFTGIKAKPALKWNDTLAKVAEARALDMAQNNYLAHVDSRGYGVNHYINAAGYQLQPQWLKNQAANYFESCNGGALSGKEAVIMLINDDGVPTLDHRKHLLGIDDWSATLVDIGIGYVRSNSNTYYKSYTCIIIAKHN